MGTILFPFVSTCVNMVATLVEERVVLVLGVKDELKRLQRRMEMIKGVLEDAERRIIQDSAIVTWLKELKDVMYDADDIIDLCRYEAANILEDQPSSSSNPPVRCLFPLLSCLTTIQMRHEIGGRIRSLNNRLEEIHKDKVMFTLEHARPDEQCVARASARMTSPLLDADVVGAEIKAAAEELVKRIVSKEGKQHQILAIVGMGGIGKTTLAQKVYNDPAIKSYFSIMVWTCVSKSYSEIELLKKIIRSSGGDCGRAESMEELQQVLRIVVTGKRLFLVLDDVWQTDVWTNFLKVPLQSEQGSGKILITTRDQNVAKGMGAVYIYQVAQLSINSGWELLRKRAYLDREEDVLSLRDVGIQIVRKCGGLPLAIKTVAGFLATKEPDKREWEKLVGNNAWSMNELPEELRGALYLSYEDLSPELKQCFLYCSLFPEDAIIGREALISFWVAEGFIKVRGGNQIMEDTAEEYYNELVRRNLLQLDLVYSVAGGGCRMHDLLRSLAQYLSRSESFYGDPQLLDPTVMSKIRRLSIATEGETIVILPEKKTKHLCLRTLLHFRSPPRVENDFFTSIAYIRVLVLNRKGIESIPDSLGYLIHLRMLDLTATRISKLPNSLGLLTNLQTLNLLGCKHLCALPRGLTQLCNLRHLRVAGTPLNDVPKGIRRLQLLNDLRGFVVASETVTGEMQNGWEMNEIESLDQLRWLLIVKLERATEGVVLEKKYHLRALELRCTLQEERAHQQPYSEEETNKIEKIFEKLSPPSCLEHLYIDGFFGRRYPTYMASPHSSLAQLSLSNCISCPDLPPLGQLPHLRYLRIEGAIAVITIGLEFLGNGVKASLPIATAFPKLEFLFLEKMPNWEEWSLGEEIEERTSSVGRKIAPTFPLSLLPRLKQLTLIGCPKLRALPDRLRHATMLQTFHIEGAHSLSAVENLPFLTQWLQIIESNSIERVSNFPKLRELIVIQSLALSCIQNVNALQSLYLVDESMECLPDWLPGLLQQRQHLDNDDLKFILDCNIRVLHRCQMGCEDWPIIQQFSNVRAYTIDRIAYLEYTKLPFTYDTNLPELRGKEADVETEEGMEEEEEEEATGGGMGEGTKEQWKEARKWKELK
ncbi:putative disease resistance protein RGA3 [Typha latifolia]|uniref:putative disease resistance protein RGA3 n=1 Tax=Typha latifolia TaxID=4733 RepID=UPI003C30730E